MIKTLLVASSGAALMMALTPALAQTAPPPGVAQGTIPLAPRLTGHVPPIIRTSRAVSIGPGERVITREELLRHVREMFARLDRNHDGFVTRDEVEAFGGRMMNGGHRGERFVSRFRESHFEGRGGGPAFSTHDRAALFDRLDTNHDGMISRQEFMAATPLLSERRMAIIHQGSAPGGPAMSDIQRSGRPGMGSRAMRMRGGFAAHLFAMADANHDGRISLQEAEAAALAHFDRLDLNHDGKITPDERLRARERMRQDSHSG